MPLGSCPCKSVATPFTLMRQIHILLYTQIAPFRVPAKYEIAHVLPSKSSGTPKSLCTSRLDPLVSCKEVCEISVLMVGTETISEALWRDSREQILKALHHPFVRQLGDGSLPRSVRPPSVLRKSQK